MSQQIVIQKEVVETLRQTNQFLKDKIAELEERNRQLVDAFADASEMPSSLGLTPSQRSILSALYRYDTLSAEQIYALLYSGKDGVRCDKAVAVHICNLRAKLRSCGITIRTVYGLGWSMPVKSKAIIFGLKANEQFPGLAEVAA